MLELQDLQVHAEIAGILFDDMARWATPQFTKGQIDRAGKALSNNNLSKVERAEALNIINNWRAIHSYPLHITKKNLQTRAWKIDIESISAQRLKRLSSIALKLRRNPNMKLTQMQDIGGCRAVLPSMFDVRQLIEVYEKAIAKNPPPKKDRPTDSGSALFQLKKEKPPSRAELVEKYDYINHPKPDGYRSQHYVFKYRSAAEDKQIYNGLRIEIQIRSKLQHAWATAVEAISTFTEQALKSGIGDVRWKRFFALMGTAIAQREDCPVVPNTPSDEWELIEELHQLFNELQVEMVLAGITATVDMVKIEPNAAAYLLVLDANKKHLEIKSYKANEMVNAFQENLLVEEQYADNPAVQAVLVSVDSITNLQSAYPNYYLDTGEFLEAVRLAIYGHSPVGGFSEDARKAKTN
jgi:ppGpp synthetase/RelA/SpoT-type nucleotidyltranferase